MNINIYEDLAKLVDETRKIESFLDKEGGEGKGLWEKADSIKDKLPIGITDKILCLALVRNKAMHGSAKIDNINSIIDEAKLIQIILDSISIGGDIKRKLNTLAKFDIAITGSKAFEKFIVWSAKVKIIQENLNAYSRESLMTIYNEKRLILNEIDHFIELEIISYRKNRFKKRLLVSTIYICVIALLAFVVWKVYS